MQKKKFPLEILRALEKFVTLKGEQFDIIDPDNFLLKVKDKDKNSDFYFYVEEFKQENGFIILSRIIHTYSEKMGVIVYI